MLSADELVGSDIKSYMESFLNSQISPYIVDAARKVVPIDNSKIDIPIWVEMSL